MTFFDDLLYFLLCIYRQIDMRVSMNLQSLLCVMLHYAFHVYSEYKLLQ